MTGPTLPTGPTEVNERAVAGDNKPPEPTPYDAAVLQGLAEKTKAFVSVSDTWYKANIANKELAGQLGDQINGLRLLRTAVNKAREEQKAPHLKNGRVVDAAFNNLKDLIEASEEKIKPILAEYVVKKAAEDEAVRQTEIAEANRVAEVARQKAFDAQQSGKIEDQVEAEKAEVQAEKQQKQAAKPVNTGVKSASGAGRTISQRKIKVAVIKNPRQLFLAVQNEPEIIDALQRVANRIVRAKDFDDNLAGVEIKIETTVV